MERSEEPLHRQLMAAHHYLGYLPKIGHTLWYVATYQDQWVALLIFSAAAWKCAVRDQWIGWDFRHQYDYDRLKLIANNSRFLILPHWHRPNLGSKFCRCAKSRLSETGKSALATHCCSWRPSSTPNVSRARSTGRPTGVTWDLPAAIGAPARATANRYAPKKVFVQPL